MTDNPVCYVLCSCGQRFDGPVNEAMAAYGRHPCPHRPPPPNVEEERYKPGWPEYAAVLFVAALVLLACLGGPR